MTPSPSNITRRRYPTSETLMAEATAAANLSDFGQGDFRLGLDVLLASLERDADLDLSADARVIRVLRRRLINRLEVEQWYREHPELENLTVRGPVDIVGFPRTGTTALANMMSLDPQFRCLRGWEQGARGVSRMQRIRSQRNRVAGATGDGAPLVVAQPLFRARQNR
jgi:Sulfotransferase family